MKILYTIANPYALGADRWIYEGYRDAFLDEGCEFSALTESDDLEKKLEEFKPDLFILDFAFFDLYHRRVKPVGAYFLEEIKKQGTKIFCLVGVGAGVDREESPRQADLFQQYVRLMDICFSNMAPEVTKDFEKSFNKPVYFIPHAANTKYYFPDKPNSRFSCDIAFVGSFYTQKKEQFQKFLSPLFKKYKVCLYGPGWTKRDKMARIGSGFSRRMKLSRLARFINARRMSLSLGDERKLYASAKICINIHEYYRDGTTKGFSNEREFKIPASGGFQLSDWIPGMWRYFAIGKEIVAVKTADEWFSAIDYYLTHELERKEIQERGTARTLKEHTYRHRVKQLINLYNALEFKA